MKNKNIKRSNNKRMLGSTQSCLTNNSAIVSTMQGLADAVSVYDQKIIDIDTKMLTVVPMLLSSGI